VPLPARRRRGRGGVLTLEQFAELLDDMPKEVEAAVVRGLRSASLRAVGFVVEEIDNAKPYPAVNTGQLRQSVKRAPTKNGAQVYVDAPHFPFIEFGTRPHMPPLEPLIVWAARKFGVDGDEARAIAWAVAQKIARSGTEPRYVFAKAMVRMHGIVNSEIAHELELL
jgi:hypothetical protein